MDGIMRIRDNIFGRKSYEFQRIVYDIDGYPTLEKYIRILNHEEYDFVESFIAKNVHENRMTTGPCIFEVTKL